MRQVSKRDSSFNENTYYQTFIELVEGGKVWALCPKCKMVLSLPELKKKKSDCCGKFKQSNLILQAKPQAS